MPEPQDHPTSLPKGSLRTCLERIRAEIVSEMNTAQHPARPGEGEAHIDLDQLQHWVNRLTEAIHFNGVVPSCISGIENEPAAFTDLDNAMRELSYIGGQPLHAKHAFDLLGKHRHKLSTVLGRVAGKLERFSDRVILTFDLDAAQQAVKESYDMVVHDLLGVR